uniref:BZIP domain-containing protein n=1 Tax=Knipowitschia caucasica TaxID=637954 RepID=A0AAV2L0K9_KNICA
MKTSAQTGATRGPGALQEDGCSLPSHDALAQILPSHDALAPILPSHDALAPILPSHDALAQILPRHPQKQQRSAAHSDAQEVQQQEVQQQEEKQQEVQQYRDAMRRMAADIISLRRHVVALHTENSRLRAHREDPGQDFLRDSDLDVMTKAEMADRIEK